MTARQVYEGVLVELNKVQAPSLLLEDFNYLFNKAINQYTNKRYNIYDVNQQTTDDLRVLKSSVVLRANNEDGPVHDVTSRDSMWGAIYEFSLPKDYLHLLNCICSFRVNKPFKCYNAGTYVQFGATRLTADLWSQIINNFYMRPTYKRPYYYIHNVNQDVRAFENSSSSYFNQGTGPTFSMNYSTLRGQKDYAEGRFGRVPSERIYSPTDPGNVDIQQLVGLNYDNDPEKPVNDLYGNLYIDDNNHYNLADRKYGIPRWAEFSELSGGSYVTGRGRLKKGENDVIAWYSFDPTYIGNTVWNGETYTSNNLDEYSDKYIKIFMTLEVEESDFNSKYSGKDGQIDVFYDANSVPPDSSKKPLKQSYVNPDRAKTYDFDDSNLTKYKIYSSKSGDEYKREAWVYKKTELVLNSSGQTTNKTYCLIISQTTTYKTKVSDIAHKITSGSFRHYPLAVSTIEDPIDFDPKLFGTDDYTVKISGTNETVEPIIAEFEFQLKNSETKKYNLVERVGEVRYGNNSNVRLEIRYGKDNSLFTLDSVYVDYIKAPQWIRLTLEQLDLTEDTSQMMEFPDYVCQEIINELVHLVMENSADPRLQSHPVVTQSIANPAQQLQQTEQ